MHGMLRFFWTRVNDKLSVVCGKAGCQSGDDAHLITDVFSLEHSPLPVQTRDSLGSRGGEPELLCVGAIRHERANAVDELVETGTAVDGDKECVGKMTAQSRNDG